MTIGHRLLAAGLVLVLVSGCETLGDKKEKPHRGVISIHAVSATPEPMRLQQPLRYAPGQVAYVDLQPLLGSPLIPRLTSFDVPDGKGLVLYLDAAGTRAWQMVCGAHRGGQLALMIDGNFRAFLPITDARGGSRIRIGGPFADDEAAMLVEEAPANYKQD